MDDFILEKRLKETLEKKAEEVCADALAKERIRTEVYRKIKEVNGMKQKNMKKIVLVAAAICIFGSITAFALGKAVTVSSHSNHNEEVTVFEEAKAMQRDLDREVKVVEEFSNGYRFRSAVPRYEESHDKNGKSIEKETAMSFFYEKEGMEGITLFASRITLGESGTPDAVLVLEDGTELHFSELVNKFVPPDYEITEEEKKLQEEGKLNVAYGSSEVEIKNSESVYWQQNGITYCLFMFGDDLSADEMLAMAKELAESR